MTNQSPITPPPDLVAAWCRETDDSEPMFPQVAAKAAQWGADQELEACLGWLVLNGYGELYHKLRATRRPKPLSLKEQSIALLDLIQGNQKAWQLEDLDLIRRALEQFDD